MFPLPDSRFIAKIVVIGSQKAILREISTVAAIYCTLSDSSSVQNKLKFVLGNPEYCNCVLTSA